MSGEHKRQRERFDDVTAEHQMTVLHDEGLYRHVRFAKPGTGIYGYDLVTWPGYLSINGDFAGGFTFCRLPDMFDFFASGPDINPSYWGEKLTGEGQRRSILVYSEEAFLRRAQLEIDEKDDLGGMAAVVKELWREHLIPYDTHDERDARRALEDFEARDESFQFAFYDTWEWDLNEYDSDFIYACLAIRHGVEMYRSAVPA